MSIVNCKKQVEKWGMFELELTGASSGNPFTDVSLNAVFKYRNRTVELEGFYDGDGIYKVRFMPDAEGMWSFETSSSCTELDSLTGSFECTSPSTNNHGPVRVYNTYHFAYADGTPHYSIGTTCYAWIHQGEELERKTLETLKSSPFNKVRMCIFPKDYDFNKNEPELYAFEGTLKDGWDFTRFNPAFFRHLEQRVIDLQQLGIEADLILFHPYDRWGFSKMDKESDDRYLHYIVARLSAYRNVWWSLANEYELLKTKNMEDWDRFFKIIQENDPSQHLRSIHNISIFYDHNKPWVTHCSIQNWEPSRAKEWRQQYKKPIVIDECGYEGNIDWNWGNMTPQDMLKAIWDGTVNGGYVGHGETYMHPDDILWWSKGGELHGQSSARIAFLRSILESAPAGGLDPIYLNWDKACAGKPGEYYLIYVGRFQASFKRLTLPEGIKFKVDVIDTWNMTITPLDGEFEGDIRVPLPGKQHMAIRITRVK